MDQIHGFPVCDERMVGALLAGVFINKTVYSYARLTRFFGWMRADHALVSEAFQRISPLHRIGQVVDFNH